VSTLQGFGTSDRSVLFWGVEHCISPISKPDMLHMLVRVIGYKTEENITMPSGDQLHSQMLDCKTKIFSRFVITTYFLLSNQLYNNLFS